MTESQPQSEMLDESAQECPPPRTRAAVDCWLRKWGRKEPLTRQDVLSLIEANGGTAQNLYLCERDMQGTDLRHANLQGAYLAGANLQGADLWFVNLQGADLRHANFHGADLSEADLQGADLSEAELHGADFRWADLQDAILSWANLQGTDLNRANLQRARLLGIQLSRETNLEGVVWHSDYVLPSEENGDFDGVQSTYRSLKTWHQEHGIYDIASEFNHREWVCRRKIAWQDFAQSLERRNPWHLLKSLFRAQWSSLAAALVLAFYEQLFGYGERPWRVVRAAVAVVLGLSLAYRYFGTFVGGVRLIDALYYSAVSFSAVGYGSWVHWPMGWAKYMGVAESFLGVFTIALFLVTFTRKMVR